GGTVRRLTATHEARMPASANTSQELERPASGSAAVAPVLLVEDLVKRFDTPEGPITAVDRVSFSVAPGELISLIGPSGCGKSTVFNIVGGLVPMSEGRVLVNGEAISGPHAAIGMVFQEESTFPWR